MLALHPPSPIGESILVDGGIVNGHPMHAHVRVSVALVEYERL
jgi:hypothetical protein